MLDNKGVFLETGTKGSELTSSTWNVQNYVGQKAEIRMVD
jgi:hypothetical protein